MNRLMLLLSSVLVLAMAVSVGSAGAAPPAKKEAGRSELDGFAIGSGHPSLALQVEILDGEVRSSAPATGPGNLRAVRSGSEAEPMLTVSGSLPMAIKFDLYLSQDGERFVYTSSCAVTPGVSSFEMWQQPVGVFALGNPRVVADGKMSCE